MSLTSRACRYLWQPCEWQSPVIVTLTESVEIQCTYHPIYLEWPLKGREVRLSTGMKACKPNFMFACSCQARLLRPAKPLYQTLLSMIALRDHQPALAQLRLLARKLHLATCLLSLYNLLLSGMPLIMLQKILGTYKGLL